MPAPSAEDEPVAVLVEGAAGAGRVVVALRERPAGDEAAETERGDGGLGAAGHHHVGVAAANGGEGVADGVGRGGAGGRDGGVRAAQAELDGDVAAAGVGDHLGDEEGPEAAGPALGERLGAVFEFGKAADAGAEDAAAAEGVFLRDVEAGVLDRLGGGDERELSEAIELAGAAGVEGRVRD